MTQKHDSWMEQQYQGDTEPDEPSAPAQVEEQIGAMQARQEAAAAKARTDCDHRRLLCPNCGDIRDRSVWGKPEICAPPETERKRLPQPIPTPRPRIVCLCGSTRFMEAWQKANLEETLAGRIVLSIGCNTKSDADLQRLGALSAEKKIELDELHKRKIDLADEVLVLNVSGYIGSSTRSEIEHAEKTGKPIRYLEPAAPSAEKEQEREPAEQPSAPAQVEPDLPRVLCTTCEAPYSPEWAGTTCSVCDGDIEAAPSAEKEHNS